MRTVIVAGNWKMFGTREAITTLIQGIKQGVSTVNKGQLIVFPPFIYLSQIAEMLSGSNIAFGAQNVSANEPGAYTGEIAAQMLQDVGCDHVLVGHSERRQLYGEDNTQVAMKFAQAQRYGLTPILCVGETKEQREQGLAEKVIAEQIDAVLELSSGVQQFNQAIIAYEPVWAIGTGLTATPEQAQEIHHFIRKKIEQEDAEVAKNLSIIYGGSVKASNAQALFTMPDIDGGLVGGASLNAQEFIEIATCIS